ncbi:MAG: hypothetical protein AAF711_15435 [Planctomycetota bacterium]
MTHPSSHPAGQTATPARAANTTAAIAMVVFGLVITAIGVGVVAWLVGLPQDTQRDAQGIIHIIGLAIISVVSLGLSALGVGLLYLTYGGAEENKPRIQYEPPIDPVNNPVIGDQQRPFSELPPASPADAHRR